MPFLSSSQYHGWINFHNQRPLWFDMREDYFGSNLLAMMFNTNRTKESNACKPEDFLYWKEPTTNQPISGAELKRKLGF